jgi:hypothetical protein
MTYPVSRRTYLIVAMIAGALVANASGASAQPTPEQRSKLAAGIDEAVKGLDTQPRLKKLPPAAKRLWPASGHVSVVASVGSVEHTRLISSVRMPMTRGLRIPDRQMHPRSPKIQGRAGCGGAELLFQVFCESIIYFAQRNTCARMSRFCEYMPFSSWPMRRANCWTFCENWTGDADGLRQHDCNRTHPAI